MKLYNADHSPYSTRVRLQVRKKNFPIEITAPPHPLRSPEFLKQFPLGKIPILELDDGTCLGESWVIMEYLEDTQEGISLRPEDPLAKAQMQLFVRYADTHLGPGALFPIFKSLMQSEERDFVPLVDALRNELNKFDQHIHVVRSTKT